MAVCMLWTKSAWCQFHLAREAVIWLYLVLHAQIWDLKGSLLLPFKACIVLTVRYLCIWLRVIDSASLEYWYWSPHKTRPSPHTHTHKLFRTWYHSPPSTFEPILNSVDASSTYLTASQSSSTLLFIKAYYCPIFCVSPACYISSIQERLST